MANMPKRILKIVAVVVIILLIAFAGLLAWAWVAGSQLSPSSSFSMGGETGAADCRGLLPPPPKDQLNARVSDRQRTRVTVGFSDFNIERNEGGFIYNHTRTFRESNGVGAYVYRGRICLKTAGDCADACLKYRLPPGGQVIQDQHSVRTKSNKEIVSVEYWIVGDNDHINKLEYEIELDGYNSWVRKK